MDKNKYFVQWVSFALLCALMCYLTVRVFSSFFTVLLWSILLYTLINPLYKRCLRKLCKKSDGYARRRLLSAGFALATLLIIIVPISVAVVILLRQGASVISDAIKFVQTAPDIAQSESAKKIVDFINQVTFGALDLSVDGIRDKLILLFSRYNSAIISFAAAIVKNISSILVSFLFIAFILYFFFLDGSYLASLILKFIPIERERAKFLADKFKETTRNLFAGYFLVGLCQGAIAVIIFICFGISNPLFFSVLVVICSLIPIAGAALVWAPLGVNYILTRGLFRGILFLIVSGIGISLLDNILRPIFLRDRIKLHPLLVFLSIIGGVRAFGFNGLILGPMAILFFFIVIDMLVAYSDKTNQTGEAESAGAVGNSVSES